MWGGEGGYQNSHTYFWEEGDKVALVPSRWGGRRWQRNGGGGKSPGFLLPAVEGLLRHPQRVVTSVLQSGCVAGWGVFLTVPLHYDLQSLNLKTCCSSAAGSCSPTCGRRELLAFSICHMACRTSSQGLPRLCSCSYTFRRAKNERAPNE